MPLMDQIWPDNTYAFIIITILISIAAVWILLLSFASFRYSSIKRQMQRCVDIRMLLEAIESHPPKRDLSLTPRLESREHQAQEGGLGVKLAPEAPRNVSELEAQRVFATFCREKSLTDRVLSKHIKAIFYAGFEGNNLDVGELIQHSSREFFRINNVLRSLLSIFIVIGLLGTLFGLSESLANLSPLLQVDEQSGENFKPALEILLTKLKPAFAPSIWGVGLTIFGVVIFSLYLSIICSRMKARLDILTLTVWVPKLIPTVSQKQLEALQQSEELLRENFSIAKKVVDLGQDLDQESGRFGITIRRAEKSLHEMRQLTDGINDFSKRFYDGVEKLTGFQEDLNSLYDQIRRESKSFQNYVQVTLEASDEGRKEMMKTLHDQNDRLQKIVEGLDAYEKQYAEVRKGVDARSEAILNSTHLMVQEFSDRNRELIEEVGKPLNETLTQNLGEIRDSLRDDMSTLADQIARIYPPISAAAESMGNSIDTIVRRTEKIARELRDEFNTQNTMNSQILGAQTKLNTNLQEQSNFLQKLDSTIAALTSKLESAGRYAPSPASRSTSVSQRRARDDDKNSSDDLLREIIEELRSQRKRGWFARLFGR